MSKSKHAGTPSREKLSKLSAFPGNARVHDDRQVEFLKRELLEVGQTRPLLVNKSPVKNVRNPIIAGNGLYEAMLALGWSDADVLWFDFDEKQASSLNLRDNRAYELGKIDKESLIVQLYELQEEGYSLDALGYNNDEFEQLERETKAQQEETEKLLGEIEDENAPDEFDEINEDIDTEHECPKCGYRWSGSAN